MPPNQTHLNAALAAERARALLRQESEREAAIRNRFHDMRAALNRALTATILLGALLVATILVHFGLPATPAAAIWSLILGGLAAAAALSAARNLVQAGAHLFKWFALRRA